MHATLHKAIRLGQQGIPVFFCSFSKRPTLPGGFHNAVAAEAAIRALYEKAPGPLIGVPTGHQFVVVDPDLQHRAARQWWKANKERLPVTRRHRTMSGVGTYYFGRTRTFATASRWHRTSIRAPAAVIAFGGRRKASKSSIPARLLTCRI